MVRRHVRSDFAADVYVFPGGKVDPADADPALACRVAVGAAGSSREAEPWLPFRLAAIRELFEEAGVLLAGRPDEPLLRLVGAEAERFSDYRSRLHRNEMTLAQIVEAEGLIVRTDLLEPFSRWITPEPFPRRFDTRFYVTRLPGSQEPLHDAVETTDGLWVSPGRALRRYRDGSFPLVFATEKHLERMSHFPTVHALVGAITPDDLLPVTPRVLDRDGTQLFLIPGDPGYEVAGANL